MERRQGVNGIDNLLQLLLFVVMSIFMQNSVKKIIGAVKHVYLVVYDRFNQSDLLVLILQAYLFVFEQMIDSIHLLFGFLSQLNFDILYLSMKLFELCLCVFFRMLALFLLNIQLFL